MPHRFDRRFLLKGLVSLPGFAAIPAFAQTRAAENAGNAPLARRLADYAESLRFTDLDGLTIERAKVHLLDSLGCGLSAFAEETVKSVRELALAAGGNAATIIGTKRRTSLEWAAFANGAAIRADDINDGYTGSAPDLGALETGCPTVSYGPRPAGVDESNQPFGCTPAPLLSQRVLADIRGTTRNATPTSRERRRTTTYVRASTALLH